MENLLHLCISEFFKKKGIPITARMIDDTMNYRVQGTQDLLDTMYTFLTNRAFEYFFFGIKKHFIQTSCSTCYSRS
jgi:hypothetical protein